MRIGKGYDFHRLVEGRDLIIGGVKIPYAKGLLGHSDADVLLHAICDALLGAAGLGDIGLHFPDNNPEFKGINSLILLEKSYEMIADKGFSILNIDSTIFAEKPRMSSLRSEMEKNISDILKIDKDLVNIKATTSEGLGIIGRGEGIGAECVVLLKKNSSLTI